MEYFHAAPGCPLPRSVAVEGDDGLGAKAPQQPGVGRSEGGPQGSHHVALTHGKEGDHIGIPLHDDHLVLGFDLLLGPVQAIQDLALVEHGSLPSIKIFRLALSDAAPAETHKAPQMVADGKHEAPPEAIDVAPLALGDQARRLGQTQIDALGLEKGGQPIPLLRSKAQVEAAGQLSTDPSALQVRPGLGASGPAQVAVEETGSQKVNLAQLFPLLLPPALPRRDDRHWDPFLFGQLNHGLGEGEVLGGHDEIEHIAPLPAAEAVVKLLFRFHGERGGLLAVERAQPHVVFPRLPQFNPAPDHFYNIHRGPNLFDPFLREASDPHHLPNPGAGKSAEIPGRRNYRSSRRYSPPLPPGGQRRRGNAVHAPGSSCRAC